MRIHPIDGTSILKMKRRKAEALDTQSARKKKLRENSSEVEEKVIASHVDENLQEPKSSGAKAHVLTSLDAPNGAYLRCTNP